MKWIVLSAIALSLLAVNRAEARCEIHPDYNRAFRNSLNEILYEVRSKEELTEIIYRLIVIDRDVVTHEMAHFNAADGWAEPPVYDTIELYGRHYRTGGCVSPKLGIPLDIAYRAALAPERPSSQDVLAAEEILRRMQVQGRN